MSLERSFLRFAHEVNGRVIAQCPACAEMGADQHGRNHLIVWPDGKFSCVAHPRDKEHRKRIWALVGDKRPRRPSLRLSFKQLLNLPKL